MPGCPQRHQTRQCADQAGYRRNAAEHVRRVPRRGSCRDARAPRPRTPRTRTPRNRIPRPRTRRTPEHGCRAHYEHDDSDQQESASRYKQPACGLPPPVRRRPWTFLPSHSGIMTLTPRDVSALLSSQLRRKLPSCWHPAPCTLRPPRGGTQNRPPPRVGQRRTPPPATRHAARAPAQLVKIPTGAGEEVPRQTHPVQFP